jgi:hypothetical protein
MKNKIKKILKKSKIIMFLRSIQLNISIRYPKSDKKYIEKQFEEHFHRKLNLENPESFNEKLQWLKLYYYNKEAQVCADKYAVRDYVKRKIGKKYLNELFAVYNSVEEINIKNLPKRFILKVTHGSGAYYHIICKDKSIINWKEEFKRIRKLLKINYYFYCREWVYKEIKPKIICEKFLEEPETGELRDYKIFCFNGKPKIIQLDFNKYANYKKNFYDLEWNFLDFSFKRPNDRSVKHNRPEKLEEMLALSRVLSKGFPFVRVDFYFVNNNIVFGELTFFPAGGLGRFYPEKYDMTLGKWLTLPKV